jgi:hypothetical protein
MPLPALRVGAFALARVAAVSFSTYGSLGVSERIVNRDVGGLPMKLVGAVLVAIVMFGPVGETYADSPAMEDVVRSPQDYAGSTVEFSGVKLSGNITKYDVGGIRKYYLTLTSRAKTFEVGFFLAPPGLADKLAGTMDPETSYRVNIACRVEKIVLNGVPQWHGFVTRVDFLDDNGRVVKTVREGRR